MKFMINAICNLFFPFQLMASILSFIHQQYFLHRTKFISLYTVVFKQSNLIFIRYDKNTSSMVIIKWCTLIAFRDKISTC
jgi:hypothetical protein